MASGLPVRPPVRPAARPAARRATQSGGPFFRASSLRPSPLSAAKPSKPRPLAVRPHGQAQATVAAPVGSDAALWTALRTVQDELADVRARKLSIPKSERRPVVSPESDRTAGARPRVLFADVSVAAPSAPREEAAPYTPSIDARTIEPDAGPLKDPSMDGASHPSESLRAEILAVEAEKVALRAQLKNCEERLVKLQGRLGDLLSCNVNDAAAMRRFDERYGHHGGGSSILTFARMHTPSGPSASPGASAKVTVIGNFTIEVGKEPDGSRRAKSFSVDLALPPSTAQAEVFASLSPLVQKVAEGKKVCVFAFGQTGSGKTYTMIGPMTKMGNCGEKEALRKDEIGKGDHRGFMPRAAELIFSALEQTSLRSGGESFVVELQAMEIAGKDCRDVFDRKSTKKLIIMNSGEVSSLMSMPATSAAQVTALVAEVQKKRATACTLQNTTSSRSHVLLRLNVLHKGSNELYGQLDLFDLAGGENIDKSGVHGKGKVEAVNINNSLRNLEMSLNMVRKGTVEGIAFRENPLTQLLRAPMCGTHS